MDEKEKKGFEQQDSRAHVFSTSTSHNWRVPSEGNCLWRNTRRCQNPSPRLPVLFGSAVETGDSRER